MSATRYGFASERRVEGGHSKVHLRGSLARCRTEAFDSLALRIPDVRRRLKMDPSFLPALLECIEAARTPKKLVASLSLSAHEAVSWAKDVWGPIYRKVIETFKNHSHLFVIH